MQKGNGVPVIGRMWLARPNVAKRMECVQLAAAFGRFLSFRAVWTGESGSKLHALHTLRDIRTC